MGPKLRILHHPADEGTGPLNSTAECIPGFSKMDIEGQEAIASNLTSKSEVELAPLFARVGECRQNV